MNINTPKYINEISKEILLLMVFYYFDKILIKANVAV